MENLLIELEKNFKSNKKKEKNKIEMITQEL